MALLPLASWAQTEVTVTLYDFSIPYGAEPTAATLKTNYPDAVKVEGAEYDDIKEYLTFARVNDGKANWNSSNVGVYSWTLSKAANTGAYNIYLSSNNAKLTIVKADNSVTNAASVELNAGGDYDAAGYDLVTTAPTVKFGEVKYNVINSTTEPAVPGADAAGWTTTAPHYAKPGNYWVYIMVDADENGNYNALAPQKILAANSVAIAGSDIPAAEYTLPTALGAAIPFDNTAHELATAGSLAAEHPHCTGIEYSLDEVEWSTSVPTATDASAYTVYYRILGIEGWYDKTGNVAATINASAPTVTSATAATNLEYTGLAQELLDDAGSATIGATPTYSVKYATTNLDDWSAVIATPIEAKADVKGTNAGFYQVTTLVAAGGNYTAASATPIVVQIQKAELTVTTDAKTKVYGEADPTFTVSYTGFKNSETATTAANFVAPATISRETPAVNNVGTYKITASQDATATNYSFVYDTEHDGSLEITQKELTDAAPFVWTLEAGDLVYTGEALTKEVTATFGGNPITSPADFTYVTTNNVNAGTANVIISGQGNFKGSIVKTFEIAPKPVYIQPKNNSKAYGAAEPNPLTTYDLVAAKGGEAIANATLNGTPTFARIAGENVGTYKIYLKAFTPTPGAATGNYTIAGDQELDKPEPVNEAKNLTATFTVNPASGELVLKFKADIAANKKSKVYGEANPAWDVNDLEVVSGLVQGDDWATVKASLSAPVWAIASQNVVNVEQNQVTLTSGLVSANYPNVTVQPMDFNVTERPITVTVEDQAITYGVALAAPVENTNWSVTTGNVIGGDVLGLTLKTVKDIYTYGVADDPYEEAITAEITNTNYALTVVKGDLTVSAGASITLNRTGDMDALIKAYDGENINVTLDRNITRTEAWFAMVLPFETTVTDLSTKYGYAVVNVLDESNTDASKVKFKLHMQTIAANQPFLIKIATAKTTTMDFGLQDIVYDADPMSKDAAGNEFHGVFKETTLAASDYLWTMVPAKNSFKKLDANGTTLTPINAYLKTKENLDAFAPTIFVEDFDFNSNTTAIKALNLENMKAYNVDGWYNLNGVKLQGVPTEKGVYINNGKKVVIK